MALDLNAQAIQFLLRQFANGNVALFAGAGFSADARNSLGDGPPVGSQLSALLANESEWQYGGEELPIVYSQAQAHLGSADLQALLRRLYRHCDPSAWQRLIPQFYWFRIYTTNIDDVIENAYQSASAVQRVEPIICPADYEDRDPFFQTVQCVHLHGSILDFSKPLTFSLQDLAQQTAKPNPWYQALVEDMDWRSFVFVGTRLTESPFHHYLALRTQRQGGAREFRAKAYYVNQNVGPIWRRQLESQNFVVIEETAQDFFTSLLPAVQARVPDQNELLRNRYPEYIEAINTGAFDLHRKVLRQFEMVSGESVGSERVERTFFFDGAEPTWTDIRNGVDAEREITSEFLTMLRQPVNGVRVFAFTGQAGSGKSTTLRRLAFELAREGETVYFSKMAEKLDQAAILEVVNVLGTRKMFFFLDDARSHVNEVNELLARINAEANVTFILADTPHILLPRLERAININAIMVEMPRLIRPDCERIIGKLEEFGFAGALSNKTREWQLREFLGRSKQQLLVAMKEATSGHGFNVIIENEYRTLTSDQARLAYAIACLAYMHGAPIRRRHLLACLDGSDVDKIKTLEVDLNGVVLRWGRSENFLAPRHRVIADHVVSGAVPFEVRHVAVIRLLTQISAEMTPRNIKQRTPEYIGYRGIINFDTIHELFGDDYDAIERVYAELRPFYGEDYLFWLQFGRAEVYFDKFSTAQNYLNHSLNIRDQGNFQAHH
jgi:hypothetical protein